MPSTIRSLIKAAGGLANQGELARRYGITRQAMNEQVRQHGFPKPVTHVGGRPLWLISEADEWRRGRREGKR